MRFSMSVRALLTVSIVTTCFVAASPAAAQTPSDVSWWESFTTPSSPFQKVLTDIGLTGLESSSVVFGIYAYNGTYLTGSSLWQTSMQPVRGSSHVLFKPFITLAPNSLYAFTMAVASTGLISIGPDSYAGG
jgi:hypothetical protein